MIPHLIVLVPLVLGLIPPAPVDVEAAHKAQAALNQLPPLQEIESSLATLHTSLETLGLRPATKLPDGSANRDWQLPDKVTTPTREQLESIRVQQAGLQQLLERLAPLCSEAYSALDARGLISGATSYPHLACPSSTRSASPFSKSRRP